MERWVDLYTYIHTYIHRLQNPLAAIGFKSEKGNTFKVPGPKVKVEVLAQACDWQVQFDLDMESGSSKTWHKLWHLPFPPEIAVVSGRGSRPDGVIWSTSTKTVIWIELTSPWTENVKKGILGKRRNTINLPWT